MKLALVEERNGQKLPEQIFDQEIIRVGRNSDECHISLDSKKFPMVSRQHAELRLQGDKWVLFDANSSYGTFVDGKKISAPQAVAVGSRIQFGSNGPVFLVSRVNTTSASFQNIEQQKIPQEESFFPETPENVPQESSDDWDVFNAPVPKSSFPNPPTPSPQQQIPTNLGEQQVSKVGKNQSVSYGNNLSAPSKNTEIPELEYVDESRIAPYKITKENIWIGRDPSGEIVFESSMVIVSRKHAEITERKRKIHSPRQQ